MRLILVMTVGLALAGCDDRPPGNSATIDKPASTPAKPPRAITASFDCDRARGQAQELVCGDANLAAMDREAARLSALVGEPMTPGDYRQQRDTCDKADELRPCVMAAAMVAIHRLRRISDVARADNGLSVGPVSYRCTGIATPLVATFVNSDPGGVALEWDGGTIAIDQVIAASGARYEGRWNGQPYTFWNKGREATFTVPGKGDLQCVEAPSAG